MLYC